MKKLLLWALNNFPALLAFALALWATADHEYHYAQFFILMAMLAGISQQVTDVRDRIKHLERDEVDR